MRAADTNVILRLIVADNPTQADEAREFITRGVWISHVVLAEMVWVLRATYRFDRDNIANAVAMLLESEEIALQESEVVAAALQTFQGGPSLDFADCLILEIARKAGHLPVGTFDRRFATLPGVERL